MNIVGYGGGTNSTAMLIGLHKRGIPVDLILFADTGGEQQHTYEYLPIMNRWLLEHGMPEITVVEYTDQNGNRLTLEEECLRSGTLPAIAYGYKSVLSNTKSDRRISSVIITRPAWTHGDEGYV